MRPNALTLLMAMFVLLEACSLAPGPDQVATGVAGTLTAVPSPTPVATSTPAPTAAALGIVEGRICFPSEGIPEMTAYFEETTTNAVVELAIPANQGSFSIELPPGTYLAYAWRPDFAFGGSYSQMVPCGLQVGCEDHTLIPFNVTAGQTTTGVDICDWYGGPGTVPYPPGQTIPLGSISGRLSYPSEAIPPLRVVAFNTQTGSNYFVDTVPGQATYVIEALPPGIYHVVAYFQDLAGGYSAAVLCGLSVDCTDHTLVDVFVQAGVTATGIDPGDWYAPPDAFPPNPAP